MATDTWATLIGRRHKLVDALEDARRQQADLTLIVERLERLSLSR